MRVDPLIKGFGPWSDIWIRAGWHVQTHCETAQARVLNPAGIVIVTGTETECCNIAELRAGHSRSRRGVVLLHGILNCAEIMNRAANALENAGWAVANLRYASTRRSLEAHAQAASQAARVLSEDGAGTDFLCRP